MNQNRSLADEKEALLAKMEASRVAYRRMLAGTDTKTQHAVIQDVTATNEFPRSHTIRWIRDHPYLTGLAVAAIVLLPQRRVRQAAKTVLHKSSAAGSTIARNQNTIRVAIGLATTALRYLANRRRY